jgi:hypothetical protein
LEGEGAQEVGKLVPLRILELYRKLVFLFCIAFFTSRH